MQSLDRAVQLGQLRWKTAINVWGVLSKMMKDASRSKVIELRVREDNPAREVQGPDRGVERAGAYLFPSEFLALMECDRVPARWKRLIMLATYLYVRVGELEALRATMTWRPRSATSMRRKPSKARASVNRSRP